MKEKTGTGMKRKGLALLTALIMIMVSIPFVSSAAEVYQDDVFEYALDAGSAAATVTGYLKETAENNGNTEEDSHVVEIPQTVEAGGKEYTVTAIGDRAFENNRSITKVILPDSVTSIGINAFNCCTKLQTVILSNGLTEIMENAFFSCTRLGTVQIRDTSEDGGDEILTEAGVVTLPASLSSIGDGAFYDCLMFMAVEIKGKLTDVGNYIFGNCISLDRVHFEQAPSKIGDQMFQRCYSLTDVNFPEGLLRIGTGAFHDCWNLSNTAGEGAGVLELPNTLESIDDRAFYYCDSIQKANVPNCTIGERAFGHCSSLTDIVFTEAEDRRSASGAEPDIGNMAFAGAPLDAVMLPQYIDEIEDGAFAGCSLTEIGVDIDNTSYESDGGVLFNERKTELVAYPAGREAGDYTVPGSVASIGEQAFSACGNLNSLTLSGNLTAIGAYAFENCSMLTSITIPDTVRDIGEGAFYYCEGLLQVELPRSLTVIDANTFEGCVAMKSIEIPGNVREIRDTAFVDCFGLESVRIPARVTEISPLAFNHCELLQELDIDAGSSAFVMKEGVLYSKDLKTVYLCLPGKTGDTYEIPEGTTKIGENAFSANTNIKGVTVPASVTSVGEYALGFVGSYYTTPDDRAADFYIISPSQNSAVREYAKEYDIAYFTGTPGAGPESAEIAAGESFSFVIENAPKDSVLFTSSDESIAKVDRKTGVVTGVSKGETYILASTGALNVACKVTVTSGEKPKINGTEYTLLGRNTYQPWEQDYEAYNKNTSFDLLDNSNLSEYTSNNYIAILAKTQGGKYIQQSNRVFGEGGYEQYSNIADNLSLEMGRYDLNENLVLFRGTNDVSQYTKARTSRLWDMYESIGTTVKTGNMEGEDRYGGDWVASTSIDHGVSYMFGYGATNHTVLEIYAPANYTRGAYINSFSNYDGEYEILLDGGTEFKVLDAGVRIMDIETFSGAAGLILERYMKLQITGVKGEASRDFGTPIVVYAEEGGDPSEPETYRIIVDKEDITITRDLQENGFDDADKIRNALYSRLMAILGSEDFKMKNTVIWDIKAVDENGDIVPAEQLPASGFKIVVPYPEKVKNNWKDYDFTILHMFGENRSTKVAAGDIEGPMNYKKTKDGLELVVSSLSPFAIHWSKKAADTEDNGGAGRGDADGSAGGGDATGADGDPSGGGAQTGDDSHLLPWIMAALLAVLTGAGVMVLWRRIRA